MVEDCVVVVVEIDPTAVVGSVVLEALVVFSSGKVLVSKRGVDLGLKLVVALTEVGSVSFLLDSVAVFVCGVEAFDVVARDVSAEFGVTWVVCSEVLVLIKLIGVAVTGISF